MDRIHMTEYLDLDLEGEMWHCHHCGRALISARDNYKKGCLVYDRDPREIHPPRLEGPYTFSPDPAWIRIVEFYCPHVARKSRLSTYRQVILLHMILNWTLIASRHVSLAVISSFAITS
jgi:hypothetical protein